MIRLSRFTFTIIPLLLLIVINFPTQQTVVFSDPVDADHVFRLFDENHSSPIQYKYLVEPQFDYAVTGTGGSFNPQDGWPNPRTNLWKMRVYSSKEAGVLDYQQAAWYKCWDRDDCPTVYLTEITTHNMPPELLALGTVTQKIDLSTWGQAFHFLARRWL